MTIKDKDRKSQKLPEYLKVSEVKALIESPYKTNLSDRLMLKILVFAGLRESELLSLRVRHINFESDVIKVEEGKGKKDRTVPMQYVIKQDMEKYIKTFGLEAEDKLFDMSPNGLYKMVQKYGKRAGIEQNVYPHLLRHTYAVLSLKAGQNLVTVQKNMGHKSISTTQIYLGITVQDQKEDVMAHPIKLGGENDG
ncbi:tyrosine-type recombinase/integrase [Sulfuricurvum sp.]|uniref:tyrosine-type recombinase/integrase n=1 Tax=Sulfuricurvum sp. TaxID=2025608 RepID=UPI0035654490